MPLYQQLIVTVPKAGKDGLVNLFKRHTEIVQKNGMFNRIVLL